MHFATVHRGSARAGRQTLFGGFTLLEMLAVIVIIGVISALAVPAMTAINAGNNLTSATYAIGGALDQARAYATSRNTYTYVGLAEVDASVGESVTPQVSGAAKVGRVALVVLASRDGTGASNAPASWAVNYAKGANLTLLSRLQRFENLHLADFGDTPPSSGTMARPAVTSDYRLGTTSWTGANECNTQFAYPLGTDPSTSAAQYTFTQVIEFNPQGIARIVTQTHGDEVGQYIEIALQETHGTIAPPVPAVAAQNTGRHSVIQVDAMTGTVRIYRP